MTLISVERRETPDARRWRGRQGRQPTGGNLARGRQIKHTKKACTHRAQAFQMRLRQGTLILHHSHLQHLVATADVINHIYAVHHLAKAGVVAVQVSGVGA